MWVAEHKDYSRKCSEAGRLKEILQLKRCLYNTRGLYAARFHLTLFLRDSRFFFCVAYFTEQCWFQVSHLQCSGKLVYWPVSSYNERIAVIFFVVSESSFGPSASFGGSFLVKPLKVNVKRDLSCWFCKCRVIQYTCLFLRRWV